MGQRSQIYVRARGKDGKVYLTARYYQWNYGERMISRCRALIDWLSEHVENGFDWYYTTETEKLTRIMDTNFDMRDVVLGCDIMQEWKEYFADEPEDEFNSHVFQWQDNNDGKLFIDIIDKTIKYAFLDGDASLEHIMDAEAYMDWDCEGWKENSYFDEETLNICRDNILAISESAQLMTAEELKEYINYPYEH